MTQPYDIVIAGAGCAGLSLAWHLLDAGIEGKQVLVVDQSFALRSDRLWCFWGDESAPFSELAAHAWPRAEVRFESGDIQERLQGQHYHCVRSEDFQTRVLERLNEAPNVTLLEAEIEAISEDPEGPYLRTSKGEIRARWIAQSVRHSKEDADQELLYPVRQHFGGLEIETQEDVFETDNFTMMDFRVPQREGVAFVYVLPFAPNKALIEHTMFSSNPLPAEIHYEASETYIQEELKVDFKVIRREAGSLPMDDRYPAQKSSSHVFNIGIVGGQMKPSTGYAFARIQAHTKALAAHYAETERLAEVKASPLRFRFYDLLLLRILHHTPALGRGVFQRLFAHRGIQAVLNFLSEKTSLREELGLVYKLPWMPFIAGIPAALKRLMSAKKPSAPKSNLPGLTMGLTLLIAWALSMTLGLSYTHPGAGHWIADSGWVALTTFLSTGIFITAHDAMHGLIAPKNRRLNRAIGWLATWSYAGLDYGALERAHHQHHAEPATDADPDYHRGSPNIVSWYIDFMRQYLSWRQFGWLCLLLGTLLFVLHIPAWRVAAFWGLPLILSTLQLFVVGTWLPHRPGPYLGDGPLRARSVELPPLLSFLACYHFGYHFEHHARPDLPWWRLWRVRGLRGSKS